MEYDTITRRVYVSQRQEIGSDTRLYFEVGEQGQLVVVTEDGDGKQLWVGEFDQAQFKRAHDDATYAEESDG
jgi:hypothetical protein